VRSTYNLSFGYRRKKEGTAVSQITVDTNLCVKDKACVEVCPSGTLVVNEAGFPEEDSNGSCIFCGHCFAVFTCDALTHSGLPKEPLLPALRERPGPEVIDSFLMSRRSVREFEHRPIAKETLEAVLDVARRAPTASNSQKLIWIVVNPLNQRPIFSGFLFFLQWSVPVHPRAW